MQRSLLTCLILASFAVAGSGCRGQESSGATNQQKAPPIAPTPVGKPSSRELLVDLSLLTAGIAPAPQALDKWSTELAAGTRSWDDVIDELLHSKEFLNRVTPMLLWDRDLYLALARYDRHPGWILKNTGGENPIYYLREECEAAEAVEVSPWWNRKSTIKVCADSHRPTVMWLNAEKHCSATSAQASLDKTKTCGCGPNMMRCAPDHATFLEFRRQFLAEIVDTVADIVDRDLPISTVYLQNETVRKPMVELQYQIWRAERGEISQLPDVLASWPAEGKRAPRYEDEAGDHSGIVTAVGTQWSFTGLRAWIRALQESMWCVDHDNSHVEAQTLLDAVRGGNSNLRAGDRWKELAAHPVCGRCHARMDYGWQFFLGYPDHRIATHFIPLKGKFANGMHMIEQSRPAANPVAPRTQRGKLYVEDFSDFRGERLQIPIEWTKWAVEQPEFGSCQSRRVAEHVFGRDATPEDRTAVAAVFEKTGRVRPTMKEALHRYVERELAVTGGAAAATTFLTAMAPEATSAPDAKVAFLPETRAILERSCLDCHDSENKDPGRNFDSMTMSRSTMMRLLDYVADRRMPKSTGGFAPAERSLFISTFVSNLWSSEADRRLAFEYYDQRLMTAAVQLPDAALSVVYASAGMVPKSTPTPMIEVAVETKELQYTPGLAAHLAVEAMRACKAAGAKDMDACVNRATDLKHLIRFP